MNLEKIKIRDPFILINRGNSCFNKFLHLTLGGKMWIYKHVYHFKLLWTFAKAYELSRKITVWCNRRNMCFCSAVRSFYRETILGILRGNARFLWPCLFEAGKDLKIITYIKGNLLDIRRLNTHADMRHIKIFL